jgi:hypothetical protein
MRASSAGKPIIRKAAVQLVVSATFVAVRIEGYLGHLALQLSRPELLIEIPGLLPRHELPGT